MFLILLNQFFILNYQSENKSLSKFELGKDVEKRYIKLYKKFLVKTMEDIQQEVDKYHTDSNLYEKYETLNNLIHTSSELDTPARLVDRAIRVV